MSEMRIYKYNGVLIGDNRVDEIVSLANNGGLDAHFDVDAKDAEVSVGNVAVGTKLAGLSLKKIIEMMVYTEQNPLAEKSSRRHQPPPPHCTMLRNPKPLTPRGRPKLV